MEHRWVDRITEDLQFIYGEAAAAALSMQLMKRIEQLRKLAEIDGSSAFDEQDAVLITYADSIKAPMAAPLEALEEFLSRFVGSTLNTVHILPFFPYSSDDGFSVIDYLSVSKSHGTWEDIQRIGASYALMFDLVANHMSAHNMWFKLYLEGLEPYRRFCIETDPQKDLREVFRPREQPLLTPFKTSRGMKYLWTTFSDDQIDLNYGEPEVLLHMIDVLIEYIRQGASMIRLDAVAFLWKEPGTRCLHHPKTHRIIQLLRHMIDAAAANVRIVTETNVPHEENISYFGDGSNEASMVYNFPLPPLTLHAFIHQDASTLSTWADSLTLPSEQVCFFNFLASHDGIGLMPAKGLISDEDLVRISSYVEQSGGFVSSRQDPDGSSSPYELNISFFDAVSSAPEMDHTLDIERFIASQSIMLAMKGIPGIYIHSMLGTGNWTEGVESSGAKRAVNRKKLDLQALSAALSDEASREHQVLRRMKQLLEMRKSSPAFSPLAQMRLIFSPFTQLFSLIRENDQEKILCITNVSEQDFEHVDMRELSGISKAVDLITGKEKDVADLQIVAYGILWLKELEP